MGNLGGAFCVWRVVKEVLKREDRHPGDLIATGGIVWGQGAVNTVMSLDLVTKRYTTLAPMNTIRFDHVTAVVDGKLYVMGGYNGHALSSVECLDLETWQWSQVAPMSTPRSAAGAAVLGGKILVVGGRDDGDQDQDLSSVESFDPATGIWTAVPPMNTARSDHGVVSAQGKLFAVGGYGPNDQGEDEDLESGML